MATKTAAKKSTTRKPSTKKTTPVEPGIGDIAGRAMLVSLEISQWGGSKMDQTITKKVADDHGVTKRDLAVTKQLFGRNALDRVQKVVNAARKEHWVRTLPWFDSGERILGSVGYLKYAEQMRDFQAQIDEATSEFYANYDAYVEEAKTRLNGAFNSADYPSLDVVKTKFQFRVGVRPLPQGSDFRVAMSQAELARLREDINQNSHRAVQGAMFELARRIKFFTQHVMEKLRGYDNEGEKTKGKFHDSLIENIRDLVELLPSINITNDIRITEIAKELGAIGSNDPDTLRVNKKLRDDVAKQAELILEKMKSFV